MKTSNLVRAYENLTEHTTSFIVEKFDLHNIVNDFFFFVAMEIHSSADGKTVRVLVDAVDGDFNKVDTYYFDVNPKEIDEYILTGKVQNILTPEDLKKWATLFDELAELDAVCEDCGEVHEPEVLEGH